LIAPEDKNKILSEYIPWGEALDSDWIPFSTKRRLTKCLKDATQALGSTGYIPYHPDYVPEAVSIAQAEAEAAKAATFKATEAAAETKTETAAATTEESDAISPFEAAEAIFNEEGKPPF
jgi:hypothetical protein